MEDEILYHLENIHETIISGTEIPLTRVPDIMGFCLTTKPSSLVIRNFMNLFKNHKSAILVIFDKHVYRQFYNNIHKDNHLSRTVRLIRMHEKDNLLVATLVKKVDLIITDNDTIFEEILKVRKEHNNKKQQAQ